MNKPRKLWLQRLRNTVLFIAALSAVACLLTYRLAHLIPVLFPSEKRTLASSAALQHYPPNILHLPLKCLQFAVLHIHIGHTLVLARLPSVLLAICAFTAFMYIARRWYGRRSMIVGGLLFATSAWFLHAGRLAGPEVEFLAAMLALLAVHIGLYDHDDSPLMMYAWLGVNLVLLTVPGFVWFVLLSLVWQWRVLLVAWKKMRPLYNRIAWTVLGVFGTAVIIFLVLQVHALYWQWLAIPGHVSDWRSLAAQTGRVLTSFVYRGPADGEIWLAGLPILDAFVAAAAVMGIIFYATHWQAARSRLIASYLVLGTVLCGLQSGVRLSILVPLVYLIATGGIAYSLYIWTRRFPRNQLARSAGIAAVVLLVAVSCMFSLRQYFVAWPHSPKTEQLISGR